MQTQFRNRCEELSRFVGKMALCAITEREWEKLLNRLDIQHKQEEVNNKERHQKILQRKRMIEQ